MLSPIKIMIVSSSLIGSSYNEPEYVLQDDYSVEAHEYMKKIYPEQSDTLGDILYKTIYEESSGDLFND